jgi:hypothetical protein
MSRVLTEETYQRVMDALEIVEALPLPLRRAAGSCGTRPRRGGGGDDLIGKGEKKGMSFKMVTDGQRGWGWLNADA